MFANTGIYISDLTLKEAKEKYQNVKVIFIKVPLEITINRVKKRKRENKSRR